MSGNARQRQVARQHKELVELGRRAKHELDSRGAELAAAREQHAAELSSLRAEHERELEELGRRHEASLSSWVSAARTDADQLGALRVKLRSTEELAVGLQVRLDTIEAEGLFTKREHEAAVEQETARLRERLRRATEERLAPKKLLISEHTREEQRLREALGRQRGHFQAIALAATAPEDLRALSERCATEIDGVLGKEGGS